MEHASSEKIAEALKLLEEAAKEKRDELRGAMVDKYTHLKNVIVETEQGLVGSLSAAGKHAVEAAARAKDASLEKAREVARDVDGKVRENPWAYIGGTAAIGLLLGYILGRNRK